MSRMFPDGLFLEQSVRSGRDELMYETDYVREADNMDRFRYRPPPPNPFPCPQHQQDFDTVGARCRGRSPSLLAMPRAAAHVFPYLYTTEYFNLPPLRELLEGWPLVRVPRVVREVSTARILSSEMVYGMPLEKTVALDQSTRDKACACFVVTSCCCSFWTKRAAKGDILWLGIWLLNDDITGAMVTYHA